MPRRRTAHPPPSDELFEVEAAPVAVTLHIAPDTIDRLYELGVIARGHDDRLAGDLEAILDAALRDVLLRAEAGAAERHPLAGDATSDAQEVSATSFEKAVYEDD